MQKKKKKYRAIIRLFWILIVFPVIAVTVLFVLISEGYLGFMPTFEELENPKSNLATEVYSSDQKLLCTYFFENRSNVKFEDLSPFLVEALIVTEDERFYNHSGIDFRGLMRSVVFMGKRGGGSTITQQLAKLLFHDPARSILERIPQKLNEWVIAVKLEKRYTKEEIITMYFNKFDFLNLAVGIKSSSKVYFNTTPDSLKIEQAAMLVGMAKNPSFYNPLRRPDTTLHRRNVVLWQLYEHDRITKEEYDSLTALPLGMDYQKVDHKLGVAPYFREYLRTTLNAHEPKREEYFDYQKYRDDSAEWAENPLYGWCNKNRKPDGEPYNLYRDGLKIYTTINSKLQKFAEESVTDHLKGYLQPAFFKEQKGRKKAPFAWNVTEKQIQEIMNNTVRRSERYRILKEQGLPADSIIASFYKPVEMTVFTWEGERDTVMTPIDSIRYYKHFLRSGFMSMEPHTGYVRAYVGGIDYRHFQYDMVSLGRRQIGSTFKPFLYTLAMQNGLSPCTKVPNVPVTFEMPEGQPPYTPQFTTAPWLKKTEGKMITLKFGLAHSMNQISARILKRFGTYAAAEGSIQIARSMGIRSDMEPYPSICVGIPEVLLVELVGAYCTFANKGVYTKPLFVTRIEDKNGNILATFQPARHEAISEETAYIMIDLMKGVTQYGTSIRLRYMYNFKGEIAGKTGTTNNHSDGWFMGITPNLVSGVWVGGEERSIHFRSMEHGQGARMAMPIWAKYMQKVYADSTLGYSESDRFEKPLKKLSIELDCKKYDEQVRQNNEGLGMQDDFL